MPIVIQRYNMKLELLYNQDLNERRKEPPKSPNRAFAADIKRIKQATGMSDAEVGAAVGVHKSTISRFRTGRRLPSMETASNLQSLGVDIERDFLKKKTPKKRKKAKKSQNKTKK